MENSLEPQTLPLWRTGGAFEAVSPDVATVSAGLGPIGRRDHAPDRIAEETREEEKAADHAYQDEQHGGFLRIGGGGGDRNDQPCGDDGRNGRALLPPATDICPRPLVIDAHSAGKGVRRLVPTLVVDSRQLSEPDLGLHRPDGGRPSDRRDTSVVGRLVDLRRHEGCGLASG